jgi:hypothetical protein
MRHEVSNAIKDDTTPQIVSRDDLLGHQSWRTTSCSRAFGGSGRLAAVSRIPTGGAQAIANQGQPLRVELRRDGEQNLGGHG